MTILKSGMVKKAMDKPIKMFCQDCGCVFTIDDNDEYGKEIMSNGEKRILYIYVKCPECNRECKNMFDFVL